MITDGSHPSHMDPDPAQTPSPTALQSTTQQPWGLPLRVLGPRLLRRVLLDHDQPVASLVQRVELNARFVVDADDASWPQPAVTARRRTDDARAEWLGVEPLGRPAERGHVQTFEHAHLAK